MNQTKEKSYMLAIPKNQEDISDIESILKRLHTTKDFKLLNTQMNDGVLGIKVKYKNEEYDINIYPENYEVPDLFKTQHLFSDIDIELIEKSNLGICVEMMFSDDYLDSYHLQLKVINSLLSEIVGIFDYSSEKILSGKWAKLTSESNVPPAPRYIYTTQAVIDDDNTVWLHTHGLNRCGITELEILNSNKEMYNTHYSIIETLANRLIEMEDMLEEKEPFYIARLSEEVYLVVTLVSWQEAVNNYDYDFLGGQRDREEGHNENTSVIYVYRSQDDCDNENYEHLSIYDELLEGNPIYMITTSETNRMKALATERINYLKASSKNNQNNILVKIGLTIDEEYQTDTNTKEHIWFELKSFDNDKITGELTQEPYYVSNLHTGDIKDFSLEDMTDWLIFTPEKRITPDEVYLLEM